MDLIQIEVQGRVMHIVLNRPEKKNALTGAMYLAMVEALERGESDPKIRAFVLRANGDSFCAGNDIQDFLQGSWKNDAVPPAARFIMAVAALKKPIVVGVQGSAAGVGVTILLHCDLVYASDDAKFVMPFVNLGLVPEAGSTMLLPALVGHRRAVELLLLATPFSAERAYHLGLVNRVVAVTELAGTATAAAQELAEKPAGAVRISKQMMKQHGREEVESAMREELRVFAERLESPETREAFRAFLEKRKPDFSKFD